MFQLVIQCVVFIEDIKQFSVMTSYVNLTFGQIVLCTLFMFTMLMKNVDTKMAELDNASAKGETWEMSSVGQTYENISVEIKSRTLEQLFIQKSDLRESTYSDSLGSFTSLLTSKIELGAFIWNKTTMSLASYQHSYCQHTCVDIPIKGSSNEVKTICPDIQCFPCDCMRPRCDIYNTCCPNVSTTSSPNKTRMVRRSITNNTSTFKTADILLNKLYHGYFRTIKHVFSKVRDFHRIHRSLSYRYAKRAASQSEPKLECDNTSYANPFLYIRSCSPDVQVSDEIKPLCENDAMYDDVNMKSLARVVDNHTSAVYYNQYCAICNGVNEWYPWSVTVECLHYMRVYAATTIEDLLRQASLKDSSCSIRQHPRPSLDLVTCDSIIFRADPVTTCNVTGRWPEYDRDVEEGCHSLTGHIYRVYDKHVYLHTVTTNRLYKNIFCAMCNKASHPEYSRCASSVVVKSPRHVPPFSILLGIQSEPQRQENSMSEKKCSNTEWPSPNGECFPLHCFPGKILVNGTCETGLGQITGLGYHLRLWFLRVENNATEIVCRITTPPAAVIEKRFYDKLYSKLSPLINKTSLNITAVVNMSTMPEFYERSTRSMQFSLTTGRTYSLELPQTSTSTLKSTIGMEGERLRQFDFQVPFGYLVTGDVVASDEITRDEFEEALRQTILHELLEVEFDDGVNGSFRPVVMWAGHSPEVYCAHARKMHYDCYKVNTNQKTEDYYKYFLNFSEVLTCSYLILQPSMFIVEEVMEDVLPSVVVKVIFGSINITFSNTSDLNKVSLGSNGTLHVCRELFESYNYRQPFVSDSTSQRFFVQYILTVVCLGLSMMCLLLALVTYAMFPTLRSVAGRNNVCLCTSLLLAQATILGNSHMSPDRGTFCVAVGVTTHFLWLSVMCWSFLCCFHMFRVFTSNTRSSYPTTRSRNMLLAKNLSCSLLLPSVVVVTVVVVMYTSSGAQSVGYGGRVCYLNSNILVGTVTVLPILCVSLINICFFLITVMHIHRVRKLQKHESFKKLDLQHLYVYIKLSTMTGAFWMMSVTGEVLNLDALRIVGILLNGLQGFFIFVSYICNKRVLSLYLNCLGVKGETPTTTTASSTDVNTIRRLTTRNRQGNQQHQESTNITTVCVDRINLEEQPSTNITTVCVDRINLEEQPSTNITTVCVDRINQETPSAAEYENYHQEANIEIGSGQAPVAVRGCQEDMVELTETDTNWETRDTSFVNPTFLSDGYIGL